MEEKGTKKDDPDKMTARAQELAVDRMLVDRFKSGDEAAFQEIVNRYWDRIYNRVHQLLKNREDAEEVTQDAFMRAHRGLENFRGDSSFSTWLFQIATNLAHNKYWYWFRRKRSSSISLDQSLVEDGDASLMDILPAEGENPTDATLTQELVDRVSENIPKLSPKHREILTMRTVRNLSYEDIAEELNISVGTVKSRIARARDSLRSRLGDDFQ
jgi:RNA polymerase sigma-70 factor (ECF subfamily)